MQFILTDFIYNDSTGDRVEKNLDESGLEDGYR